MFKINVTSFDKLYLSAFFFACLLFWWMPTLVQAVQGRASEVEYGVLSISAGAFIFFLFSYLLSPPIKYPRLTSFNGVRNVNLISKKLTLLLLPVAIVVAVRFFLSRGGAEYGYGEGLSTAEQAVLYLHLYFGLVYFATLQGGNIKSIIIIMMFFVVAIPRLIISLRWGRFFFAQAIVPIIFLLLAQGLIILTRRKIIWLAIVAVFIVFIPALARGDDLYDFDALLQFFSRGSTLILFQDNMSLDLGKYCEPILVSLTAKLIPYSLLNVCTIDIWGQNGLPATLDRILAYNEIGDSDALVGPGSNFILELYLLGGWVSVVVGSAFLGFIARQFVRSIMIGSIFSAIWVESLVRLLLAPRSNFGYVFERIPSLFLTSLLFLLLVYTIEKKGSSEGVA